jgi:acyl CoA:acetate/3-ketoacid CoA transferase alpha subunit
MKPNSTFKLSKQTKRFMCTIVDNHKRGEFKRTMIGAEMEARQTPRGRVTRDKAE